MGRGVSSGGGQSSLGYLFGNGEAPKPAAESAPKPAAPPPVDNSKQVPAGIQGSQTNNYFRADGQNCGNFIVLCEPHPRRIQAPKKWRKYAYRFTVETETCIIRWNLDNLHLSSDSSVQSIFLQLLHESVDHGQVPHRGVPCQKVTANIPRRSPGVHVAPGTG